MSDWVERIGGGYVNLAVASELDASGQDSMGRHYLVRDSRGEALGRIHATDLPGTGDTIVADQTGTVLCAFWQDGDDIAVTRYPVVAWRVPVRREHEYAVPVIAEDLDDYRSWCLELCGRYVFPGDADCESLDAARAHAAERLAAHARIEAAQRQRAAAKGAKGTEVADSR
ncbi:MAG: hypothetical protein H0X67_00980 [Acidobacteria bacterium]|nr:hypothetical protein [Acidobacteriota bacterium]